MEKHWLQWTGGTAILIYALLSAKALGQEGSLAYPTVNLAARIHGDFACHQQQLTADDGVKLRRLRAKAYGQMTPDVAYELDMGFADQWQIKDVWLAYQGLDYISVKLGQYKTPFNLEELISSDDIMFMERALPNALAPQRKIGASLATSTISGDNSFTADVGLFNNATLTDDDSRIVSNSELIIGRMTVTHHLNEQDYWHLGLASGWVNHLNQQNVTISSTPESAVTDEKLVDTGVIQGAQNASLIGMEGMVNWQSLLVQTEYLATLIGRNDHDNVFFDGWYINMGWVIAGNQYRYKRDQAVLGQVVPKHPYGAWEIAARYSEIDLADHDIAGGRERNLTLGINWYPAKWCRFMANYIHVNANDNQRSYHPQIWALRAQLLLNQKLK